MKPQRLYIITRADLNNGLKTAQACHAAIESAQKLNLSKTEIPYVIILEAVNELHLNSITERLETNLVYFREPDLENQLTAISFLEDQSTKSITKKLKLVT